MRFYSDLFIASFFIVFCWSAPAHAFDVSTQQVVVSGYATSMVTSAPFDPVSYTHLTLPTICSV